jgi:hypothetical protein
MLSPFQKLFVGGDAHIAPNILQADVGISPYKLNL